MLRSSKARFIACLSFVGLSLIAVYVVPSLWKSQLYQWEEKSYHTLDKAILEEVAENAVKEKHQNAVNFSVLMDPYYTVPIKNVRARNISGISCNESYTSGVVNYKICYYAKDGLVVMALEKGIWQWRAFGLLLRALQRSPGAAFIDVGTNIGLFSLPIMAAMGSELKIIAVEANGRNIEALIHGIGENKFAVENWAIIHRALSNNVDVRTEFVLDKYFGASGTLATVNDPKMLFEGRRVSVLTATFDSHVLKVAQAMNITAAVMKVDIEGSECVAVQTAKRFFAEINVLYVVLEIGLWNQLQNDSCLVSMFSILKEFALFPFKPDSVGTDGMLDTTTYRSWMYTDVIWKKII